jgi:glycosyltransferase involved in cell wall biosynthesis
VLWRFFLDPQGIGVLLFVLKNVGKLWKTKYDIVIPMDGGWEALIVRKLTWLYGGKEVISGQSGKGWVDRINILCCPNIFVSLSSWSLRKLKWMNPFIKYRYIPNGVDLEKFEPKGEAFEVGLKKPVVLAAGAFTEQKRLDLAIKAVGKLKNVSLLVVGGGGEKEQDIKILGEKILGDRFKLLSVPFEKMPEIYQAADVFTLPSASSEAFGNVFVEAMASGLPVVATNDPIRNEIIGDAGILIDPTDTEAYSLALMKALEINWSGKPRRQAEKFDWDKIAEQYEDLFKALIKEK